MMMRRGLRSVPRTLRAPQRVSVPICYRLFSTHHTGDGIGDIRTWSPDVVDPLQQITQRVDSAIREMESLRAESPLWKMSYEAVRSIASAPKRHYLLPQLVLLGHAEGAGAIKGPGVIQYTAGVELHHLFMLIHDDIMDKGTFRRGMPTLGVVLSRSGFRLSKDTVNNLATIVGDVLHAKSMGLLMDGAAIKGIASGESNLQEQLKGAVEIILSTSYRAGAAQFDDIVGWRGVEGRIKTSEEAKQLIRGVLVDKRSGHGIVSPLIGGLRFGGANRDLEEIAAQWGECFGVAFQGLDDVFDFAADPLETGKDSFQDFREGRLSLPLFVMRNITATDEWASVRAILDCGSGAFSIPDRRMVLDIADRRGLVRSCLDIVRDELSKAGAAREQLSDESNATLKKGLYAFERGLQEMVEAVPENIVFGDDNF